MKLALMGVLAVGGGCLMLASIAFVCKILDRVYLGPLININAAVVGFFTCMALFILGMFSILYAFGLLS